MVPTSREEFTEYCLRKLGKPVIEINVDEDQVSDRIDEALRYYWDYHFDEPENPNNSNEYNEELDRLIKQAVTRQLVTDVELGSYLSGGMDSGTLTALEIGRAHV